MYVLVYISGHFFFHALSRSIFIWLHSHLQLFTKIVALLVTRAFSSENPIANGQRLAWRSGKTMCTMRYTIFFTG